MMCPCSSLSVKKNPISVGRTSAIVCKVGEEGMVRPLLNLDLTPPLITVKKI
jgi:hypothetical protein